MNHAMVDVVFEYFIDEPVAFARVANFSNPLICHPEDSVGTIHYYSTPCVPCYLWRTFVELRTRAFLFGDGEDCSNKILTRKLYFCMNLLRNNLVHCSVPTKLPNRAAYILIAVDGCLSRSWPPKSPRHCAQMHDQG